MCGCPAVFAGDTKVNKESLPSENSAAVFIIVTAVSIHWSYPSC